MVDDLRTDPVDAALAAVATGHALHSGTGSCECGHPFSGPPGSGVREWRRHLMVLSLAAARPLITAAYLRQEATAARAACDSGSPTMGQLGQARLAEVTASAAERAAADALMNCEQVGHGGFVDGVCERCGQLVPAAIGRVHCARCGALYVHPLGRKQEAASAALDVCPRCVPKIAAEVAAERARFVEPDAEYPAGAVAELGAASEPGVDLCAEHGHDYEVVDTRAWPFVEYESPIEVRCRRACGNGPWRIREPFEYAETAREFVPPIATDLPDGALDSAAAGGSALDAFAQTAYGRNLLAHALVALERDGYLRPRLPLAPRNRRDPHARNPIWPDLDDATESPVEVPVGTEEGETA